MTADELAEKAGLRWDDIGMGRVGVWRTALDEKIGCIGPIDNWSAYLPFRQYHGKSELEAIVAKMKELEG